MSSSRRFYEYCMRCQKRFDSDRFRTRCDVCAGAMDVEYDLEKVEIYPNESNPILRYRDLIPVMDPSNCVSVGAGNTPCVHARALGRLLGLPNLFLKDETKNPTGTVKDRPAEVVLSYLKERGTWHFTSSATGNSSTAFARACILNPPFQHSIFVGERWLDRLTFDANERVHVWVLEGKDVSTKEAIAFSRKWERENDVPAEGGFFNIGRREGLKLAYLEAVDQLSTSFDWYVQGVSTAMGAFGTYKGALQYRTLGRVDRIPKMGLVQESTCAPQVHAWREGSSTIQPHHILKNPDGIADALLKGDHSETYPYVHQMMMHTGGTFVSVTADEIRAARRAILEYEGISACCAASTTVAGIRKLVERGEMKPEERILVALTGSDRNPAHHVKTYRRVVRTKDGWEPEVKGAKEAKEAKEDGAAA
ncbi:pyridoxal-phosphate dependent enzyme [Pendulispora brunnea]|uniref:Pyridoxal-phosphate dependent enzyme n=1 Tax=Pendulispora brunnea TaxID=2905690 RepID=A0ABZ2K4B9_9BACT